MKDILLVCSAGVTSAKLVNKMQETINSKGLDIIITASGVAELKDNVEKKDLIFLSPQAAYLEETVENMIDENTKVVALSTDIYANIDYEAALDLAIDLLDI